MSTYYILNYIGAGALFVYNFFCMKKRQELTQSRFRKAVTESRKEKWCLVVETLIISIFQYAPILIFNKSFGFAVGTGANYFGLLYLAPVFLGIGCFLLGTDWMNQIDLLTPAYPLALFFSKIGCFFGGCCSGIQWEYGIPNFRTGAREFPAQLLEALVAFLIFIFFYKYGKKLKRGTAFPIYVIVYSSSRFLTEFLRVEKSVFMGLKMYHILCLIGVLVGLLEYYFVLTDNCSKN